MVISFSLRYGLFVAASSVRCLSFYLIGKTHSDHKILDLIIFPSELIEFIRDFHVPLQVQFVHEVNQTLEEIFLHIRACHKRSQIIQRAAFLREVLRYWIFLEFS